MPAGRSEPFPVRAKSHTLERLMPAQGQLRLRSFGASDVGRRRSINEDAFLCDDEAGLWVVADGMGGHAAGEVASRESIDTISGMVRRGKQTIDLGGEPSEEKARAACRVLEGAVQGATYLLFAMAELDRGKAGMGTTISAMMSFGDSVALAQVGDSRIYRARDGQALQLTEDHTLIAWQLKQGLITSDQARVSKQRNVITRAVGSREYVQVDTSVWPIEAGDRYLLCSDGLHTYVQLDEIADILEDGGQAAVDQLIDLANGRGGRDNITAIVVEGTLGPR